MRHYLCLPVILAVLTFNAPPLFAGIWTQPDVNGPQDAFGSVGVHSFILNLGPLAGVSGSFEGSGPTIVNRDRTGPGEIGPGGLPHIQDGLDTIDTEIVSMNLVGSSTIGLGTVDGGIVAGQGNSFAGFDGIVQATRGQIQDLVGTPDNGTIDFPANSFFDVFFDVWVDLNDDEIADEGEVFTNDVNDSVDQFALRMAQELTQVPPELGTVYNGGGTVNKLDADIGTFQAIVLPPLVPLYRINFDRTLFAPDGGLPFAFSEGVITHEVVPEPASFAIFGIFAVGLVAGPIRRRKQRQTA